MKESKSKLAVASATKRLLQFNPVERISVMTICREANVDRRSFYRHFRDKYDVVDWVYYHEHFENLKFGPERNIWDIFLDILSQLYEDRMFYRNALRYHGQNSFREYGSSLLMEQIQKDFKGTFSDSMESELFVGHALNMIFDACETWLTMDPCPPPNEFAQQFMKSYGRFQERNMELMKMAEKGNERGIGF